MPSELHLPEEMHAGSLHLQTHNPLSKAPIQLCALSQAATVTRLDTDRKLDDALARPPAADAMICLYLPSASHSAINLYYTRNKIINK